MFKIGDAVYAISVDIRKEEDWNTFMNITDWFVDDAPIDELKQEVLSHPGWCHFMDLEAEFIDEFMESKEWKMLRDSGLSVVIKYCVVSVKGYLSPNDSFTKNWG